jgi:hypothetical protein
MVASVHKLDSKAGEPGADRVASSDIPDHAAERSGVSLGRALIASALALFAAAGGLLWWHRGAAVFGELMVAGLAWCL